MVDYMDHSFKLQHNGYQIVTRYRRLVVVSLVKVCKLAQDLASAPYRVMEGNTRVFVIRTL